MNRLWLTPLARQDLAWWRRHDRGTAREVLGLLRRLQDDTPLPTLRLTRLPLCPPGLWSFRLRGEHRIVIERMSGFVVVHQCRFHY
ncbi:type II toxin-antitoxin system YoeB family toxin [Herbaspirillum sp. AP02]|uniref:type II toxin-antitoxin system YoeB family toxin n=1 Tax=unclassified Herbaspirillum TaxID=2624150 RepID=UPI0015DB62E5|nr:type II toxin-antitoxin system YoeB family toxin [Herbaspirillum sp. AP02]NZD66736.1 type II toxin-antitoxin system YoeB family toxin [Herbaspirillum sp. AP21]